MKPRDLAEKLIAALPADAQISKVEIAGPGFLNFFQNSDALAAAPGSGAGRRQARRTQGTARRSVWWSTCPRPTWPRKCTSATCARPSSVTPWRACWSSSATR